MLCWPCIISFFKNRRGRPFLTMVTRWSRSTSNFYALIGQNLTDELMRKIYAASWKLFTLTAEADRVLCQLVMCLTVFFYWMYKMKFSYNQSSVIHVLFVYWVFGWKIRHLHKLYTWAHDTVIWHWSADTLSIDYNLDVQYQVKHR